jgi:internalin A
MNEKELLSLFDETGRKGRTYLDLSGKNIENLPTEIGLCVNLEELDLSTNRLSSLPSEIGCLTNLKVLILNSNKLISFPPEISQLVNLINLDLGNNQLTSLPPEIWHLTQLKVLYLYVNQLTSLTSEIGNFKQLMILRLDFNQFTSLPLEIGYLAQLTDLSLISNQLKSLPPEIGKLTQLKGLHLSGNHLTTLPLEIGKLKQLKELNLDDNHLTSLPPEIQKLSKLERIFLHDNPALGIPPEILGPSWEDTISSGGEEPATPQAILDYYFRTRVGRRPLNEAKLILVGRGEVGKTCIVNQLVHKKFEDTSKTQGIQISDWKMRVGKDDVRLNIWDFGGQEIMHATHQFFLTERSLYLLVLNGREGGEDYDAEYWLKLIESFAGDSPIIVVLNKINQNPFDLNYRGLQAKYPQICGFLKTDCKTPSGLHELHEKIVQVLSGMKNVKADFPSSWFAVKDALAGMEKNYLSFEQFRDVCRRNKEEDAKAQEDLAYFLHCLGIALNYKDDPRLRDTSVLNPRWVTEGIYRLLNAEQLAETKGVLKLHDLGKILPSKDYPPEKHEFLMELMRKFRLCFAFPDGQHRYLVPELLGKEDPDLKGEFDPKHCLNFEYHYSILPEGLLPQFIVRTHPLSHEKPRWRTGVVLSWEGCRALVKADAIERKVSVRVRGDDPEARRRLLAVIRSDFERIHADISRLEVKAKVPLPEHPDIAFDYDELVLMEQKGVNEFPKAVKDDIVKVKVSDLLNGVDLPDIRRKLKPEERERGALRLFFSYSHKDEVLRDELETHLKLMQREKLISAWNDRRIFPGEEWDRKIDENLEKADIILLLVSADFIASDYCFDIEMNRAMERNKNKETVVIPVILRDYEWHSAPFGKLQALPRDGKPVTLWSDRDTAWSNVAQGIRNIAEKIKTRNASSTPKGVATEDREVRM